MKTNASAGKKEEGYIKSSDDGWFYVETSLSVSGFVYLKAVACDEHKNPIEDISEIKKPRKTVACTPRGWYDKFVSV